MTRKEQEITELYLETIQEVSNNKENWLSFLKSASYNYKYRFDEQILIYAQKPEATAVAETTVWNKKLKRWINKGSKGIALMTEKDGELGLRFVFDVSDTNSNMYGRKFKLWTAEEKYHDDIIEALENKFGTMESKDNLPFAIMSTAFNHVAENMQDYLEQLKPVIANSKLEQLSDKELEDTFLELLMYSTVALTLSRCGMKVEDYIQVEELEKIRNFNTFETMTILGTATRDFSKEILLEISETVINVQKREKNQNHTFDKNKQQVYDKIIKNLKGSVNNEYNLQRERELSNTRGDSTTEQKQQSEIGQASTHEVGIPKREQDRNVRDTSNKQQVERPLDRNRKDSEEQNTTVSRTNEETREDNRRIESTRPDGMGGQNEQHSSDSRADSNKRTNTSIEEQPIEKGADSASFFDETTKNIQDLYNFKAGDVFYIGEKGFTIIAVDNEKMLIYDNNFPLYQETVEIKSIIDRIAENPVNDYLKENRPVEKQTVTHEKENIDISFNNWLDTFIDEKGISLNDIFEIEENGEHHIFEIGNIVENIKATSPKEQAEIKDMLVKIDFYNGDIIDYFKHLAKALVINEREQMQEQYEEETQNQEENAVNEEIAKRITNPNRNRNIEYFDLHPEIPTEKRNNFKIKDDLLGVGTAKEKFKNNVEAIKILKLCEQQNRYATPEEQKVLSKYVGWGGLKSAFEQDNNSWSDEYNELKNLLTDEEYKNARQSSLTAYYTPPVVIRNIYKALQNMGLRKANVLEPSCRSW